MKKVIPPLRPHDKAKKSEWKNYTNKALKSNHEIEST